MVTRRLVIKMLIAVLVCFILCWTPQQCLLLYDVFRASHQVPGYLPGVVKFGAVYLAICYLFQVPGYLPGVVKFGAVNLAICYLLQVPGYLPGVKFGALYLAICYLLQVPDYLPGVKFGALYLAYINSAVNPLLYGSFNQHFRRGFRHLFRCLGGRLPLNKVHPASGGGGKGAVRGRGGRGEEAEGGTEPAWMVGVVQVVPRHTPSPSTPCPQVMPCDVM
ncbi:hypothetical protein ACOMHN_003517 [Nucella lapillus]